MRACSLRGLLTTRCQQLESNGYFGTNPYTTGDGEALGQYINDKVACSCMLPTDIAKKLNDDASLAIKNCDIYPATTKEQDAIIEKINKLFLDAKNRTN